MTVKGFWQHKNGKIYAIMSTSFGEIIGGAGPLEPNQLQSLESYDYKPAIVQWLKTAIAQHELHKINLPVD
jgi:hypothetical protein